MRLLIENARIFAPEKREETFLIIEGEKILALASRPEGFVPDRVIDAAGLTAVPGFIDLHVHGGGGHSMMEGTAQSVVAMANAHARFGTTTILPTTWTAPLDETERAIDAVGEAMTLPCDATIAGVHLEGPFLSPAQCGAQTTGSMLTPATTDWRALLDRGKGIIRMMGAAPEVEGALALGDALCARGIVASIAHSQSYFDEITAAVAHGYSDVTHLYSGCSTFIRRGGFRVPGVVECGLLMDELTIQVIADGRHLPLSMLKMIWRAKGSDKMYLITDALLYAGTALEKDKIYIHDGKPVIYEDEVIKLATREAFAGSIATTDRLLRTAVEAGIPFAEALKMLTVNPARRIGLDGTKGRLLPGYDADIVFLSENLKIAGCIAKGRVISWTA